MVYPYITLADGTEIVHTQVFEEQGIQKVEVHFERPTEDGFDTARCQLPSYTWLIKEGFSAEEMDFFDRFMHSNAHLFYKYGTNGGVQMGHPHPRPSASIPMSRLQWETVSISASSRTGSCAAPVYQTGKRPASLAPTTSHS